MIEGFGVVKEFGRPPQTVLHGLDFRIGNEGAFGQRNERPIVLIVTRLIHDTPKGRARAPLRARARLAHVS